MREMTKFYKGPDHFSEVEILEKKPIGGGEFGEVSQIEVQIGEKQRTFVLKEFKDRKLCSAEEYANNAIDKHTKLKNAGIKVFPTYRLGENGRSVLMTSGHSDKFVCIGTNEGSRSLKDFPDIEAESIDTVSNFDSLLKNMFDESRKAAENKLLLPEDTFFFLANRDNIGAIDFVVGDLDIVSEYPDNKEALRMNNSTVYTSIYHFIKNNVSKLGEHKSILDAFYQEITNGEPIPLVTEEEIRTMKKIRT
jgi:hypothetical protein